MQMAQVIGLLKTAVYDDGTVTKNAAFYDSEGNAVALKDLPTTDADKAELAALAPEGHALAVKAEAKPETEPATETVQ
jgi:hypothetical protein